MGFELFGGSEQGRHPEGSHPAIIEQDMFDLVQHEFQRRAASGQNSGSGHPFSGKIFCGNCGGLYGPKIRHSNDKFRSVAWQCNTKYAGEKSCGAQCLRGEDVEEAFLAAFNQRLDDRDAIFEAHEEALRILADTAALDEEAAALAQECEVVMELTRKAVRENASAALDQDAYQERYDALAARYGAAHARLGEIEKARTERRAKRANITRFMKALDRQEERLAEFEEELWYTTVDKVKAFADGRLVFCFRDECEVEVSVRGTPQEELQAA